MKNMMQPYKAYQHGYVSLILITLLILALGAAGYFLYESDTAKQALQNQLAKTQKHLRATQQQLTEKEETISAKESELYKLRSQRRSLKKKISGIEANLTQQSSSENDAINELKQKLKLLDKQNNKLQTEQQRLVKQFNDGTTIIRLEDSILFPIGSASLNRNGRKTLALVAETLRTFPNHLISVEGHTDQNPIISELSEKYPSNWELSTARAAYAIRYLVGQGLPEKQFQAVGHSSTRPISKGATQQEQQKNRRIEILVYPPEEAVSSNQQVERKE